MLSRRQFLLAASSIPAILGAGNVLAADFWSQPRSVWLLRQATGESFRVTYFADGKLIPEGYAQANWLLRDVKMGQTLPMSIVLLDVLCGMSGWYRALGYDSPIVTTSGYRTETTNSQTEGAVRNSRHKTGQAHDGFVYGVPIDHQVRVGMYLRGGGVGWYPSKHMVHVDDGNIRAWRG